MENVDFPLISNNINLQAFCLCALHFNIRVHHRILQSMPKELPFFIIKMTDEPTDVFSCVVNRPLLTDALWMLRPLPPVSRVMFWHVFVVH